MTTPARAAETALHHLLGSGDVYDVGGRLFFVSPIDDDRLLELIEASAATEDDEDDDGEPSLGWADTGSQEHLRAAMNDLEWSVDDEGELDLSDYEPDSDNEPENYLY